MTDKPKLTLIDGDGGRDAIGQRLFRILLRSMTQPKTLKDADLSEETDRAEMEELYAVLNKRGDLSVVKGGQECASDTSLDENEKEESK